MNRIYYHAFLDDYFSWAHIFVEQMTMIEKQNIFSTVDKMRITAITKNDVRAEAFHRMCSDFAVNIEIHFIESKYANDFEMLEDWSHLQGDAVKPLSETVTLSKVYEDSLNTDMNVLYLHAKSVTSTANLLLKYRNTSKFKNRHLWRKFMNYGVIENWQKCTEALLTHDTAGIDFQTTPPHYKGGFWWAKSNHIRQLSHPEDNLWWENLKKSSNDRWIQNLSNRFRDEFWLCSKPNTKSFNVASNNGYFVENDI